ncbi:uncharacterized protein METZ01_LOCUS463489 [marine metagenome]|uniref:Uncharacterized protein n=1 Tax=marine metagenome TaxID=408172 RepID=A0A383ATW2_9ZZZZ
MAQTSLALLPIQGPVMQKGLFLLIITGHPVATKPWYSSNDSD